jgi:histidinol-phosphate aminotransferase
MYVNPYIKDLYRVKFHDARGAVLRLDMNENPGGLPSAFVESVKDKITPEFLSTYPEKDNITALIAEHNSVNPKHITVTCGSDEALRLIFQCFGEAGKRIVTVTPTFEMYGVYANMFGMKHISVPYSADFTVSADDVRGAVNTDTSIVFLLNPNSPIGTRFADDETRQIIDAARANSALVVIDEAYCYFNPATVLPLIREYDNLLILRTFSKLFSIAALRIGYAAGAAELIRCLENAESTFNVNSAAILFAGELLKRPDMIDRLRKDEADGREWLRRKLEGAGYAVPQSAGNFLLFRPKLPSGELVARLKERGIWIRDYSKGVLTGYARVSTGAKPYMERFWEAFAESDHA